MAFKTFQAHTKDGWGIDVEKPTLEQINTGCLLRIADAVDKMANPYMSLLREAKWNGERIERLEAEVARLTRSNAALRGAMKRAKAQPRQVGRVTRR